MFNINFADDWIQTAAEATTLPTEPQPLPNAVKLYLHVKSIQNIL